MFALFEDRLAGPEETAAWLFTELVSAHQADWSASEQTIALARECGHWVVVALPYEMGAVFEPSLGEGNETAHTWVFAKRQALTHFALQAFLAQQKSMLPDADCVTGVAGVHGVWSSADYQQALEKIQAYIRAGDCYQVNLTFPLSFDFYGHPLALYLALRSQQATRYGGLILDSESPILSLSPELFVEKQGHLVRVRPMKGTAARQLDEKADKAAAADLAQSAKNRAENVMIVDLLRNDLGKLAQTGRVQVERLFQVEPYPAVWQMVSEIRAELPDDLAPEKMMPALFPCGSITGAPKIRAMQIIQEVESVQRGVYTGALGWFAPNGDCRLNVAIRTVCLQTAGPNYGVGVMGVGSGIVYDSVVEDEWRECWLKAHFLTTLPSDLALIETLRLEVEMDEANAHKKAHFPLLAGHLRRLAKSAQYLGFAYDEAALRTSLQTLAETQSPGCWRVRVLLKHKTTPFIEISPLSLEPSGPRYVTVSMSVLNGKHPLRQHKTTWRAEYDHALRQMASDPSCFDVLFFNTQGYLMEGARSTVLALIDGQWQTPPVESGALPGVWRHEVLAGHDADFPVVHIGNISRADLSRASRLVCGNALRGWVNVGLRVGPYDY